MKFFRRPSSGPLWQDEFSVFAADERYVNRRQFAKFLVLTSLGMFVGNLWILVKSWFVRQPQHPVLAVARVGEVPVGGVKLFTYPEPEDPCILVRLKKVHRDALRDLLTGAWRAASAPKPRRPKSRRVVS